VAIPAIRTDLGASGAVAGLVVGGYRLVSPPSTAYWLAVTYEESRWERAATGSSSPLACSPQSEAALVGAAKRRLLAGRSVA